MKKYITVAFVSLFSLGVYAQDNPTNKETDNKISFLERHNDQLNIFFHIQSSFDVVSEQSKETDMAFKARQFRLEIKGNLTDKLFYRFRQRLNKPTNPQSLDNLGKATDYIYVGYKATDKITLITGKQRQAWGGFEFDLNAINVHEYSDFINAMDNSMMGGTIIYTPFKNQEFQFQITNNRNSYLEDIYGDLSAQGIEQSHSPLAYVINWNGSFLNKRFQTRWAYGIQTEAKNNYSKMITLGTKYNLEQFQLTFDFMNADEKIDRLGIATKDGAKWLEQNNQKIFRDVTYNTLILKAEFQPKPEWNIFAKGMYETTSVKDVVNYDDDFRKAYGYMGGVEYLPFKDQDLRLFLAYIGRKYVYTKAIPTLHDFNTDRVSLGVMYRIKAF
ncbi:Phosphate-selective porin O and P [Kaistella chaponensis]|uniref:Phosphate-selective porin O and P n=1 Tax=Kaistella chaponensis TaxID=713588 RepID=A0A1N7MLU6_9FLAO|nr:porin [Kaistella chaponensis]SIS87067.1 Phosphate-selective porin O and P [Kaistella chaponensis]